MPSTEHVLVLKRFDTDFSKNRTTVSENSNVVSAGTLSWTDTKAGIPNPKHAWQITHHHNAGTPFSGQRVEVKGTPNGFAYAEHSKINSGSSWDIQRRWRKGSLLSSADLPIPAFYSNTGLQSLVNNQALADFYNNSWDALRSLQSGVFLGEVRETLKMLKNPARTIRDSLNSYATDARRRYRKATHHNGRYIPSSAHRGQRALADTWLEYAFGWRPLISDIKDANSAFVRLAKAPYEFQRVRGYSEAPSDLRSSRSAVPVIVDLGSSGLTLYREWARYTAKVQCRYLGEVRVKVDTPYTMAREVLGFTWNDFVPTVWELIPYSFLVDYFSNIGDVISAWSFPNGSRTWHNRTRRTEATLVVLGKPRPPNPYNGCKITTSTVPDLQVELTSKTVLRDQNILGFPSVTFEIPGSSSKWLNLAALGRLRTL